MARYFRQTSTSQWLARVDNPVPMPAVADHLAHVAAEYGIAANDLTAQDDAADPRSGTLVTPPPRPPTPDETELSQLDVLIAACLDGTATAPQVRTLLGRLAQRLRNRARL